jgi:uncharacterized protein (DUF2236 family)
MPGSPIFLPLLLQRRLEAAAVDFIQAGPGAATDFSVPPGEPALVPPGSVSWKVFKNPLTLFIGGVAAVVLELAEPRVRSGVWEHTTFRREPLARIQRTGLAALMTVYGPYSQAKAMIARVSALHGRVRGVTSDGQPYRADEPELLDWVQATASYGFLEAYCAFVQALNLDERDRYYREGRAVAQLYGASGAPLSQQAVDSLFETMRGKLQASPVLFEFLALMRGAPLLPRWLAPLQRLLVRAALEIVPPWMRERLGIDTRPQLGSVQRRLLVAVARASDRIMLRDAPAVQSCRRLGLPDDYLYR